MSLFKLDYKIENATRETNIFLNKRKNENIKKKNFKKARYGDSTT